MNRLELVNMLKAMSERHGSQKRLAEVLGVSESYLSDVINMNRHPGRAILSPLRLRRRVTYLPLEEDDLDVEDD